MAAARPSWYRSPLDRYKFLPCRLTYEWRGKILDWTQPRAPRLFISKRLRSALGSLSRSILKGFYVPFMNCLPDLYGLLDVMESPPRRKAAGKSHLAI